MKYRNHKISLSVHLLHVLREVINFMMFNLCLTFHNQAYCTFFPFLLSFNKWK